jgi:hypothetical protein
MNVQIRNTIVKWPSTCRRSPCHLELLKTARSTGLEHPQRIKEEGGSVKHVRHVVVIGEEAGSVEHLIMSSSSGRRPTVVDLVYEDDEEGRSTSTGREEGGTWKKHVAAQPNAVVVRL